MIKKLIALKVPLYDGFAQEFEDLCAASSLAHDLGHPPFGHTGQKILNELTETKQSDPNLKIEFDDNKQVLHGFVQEDPDIAVTCAFAAAT